MRLNSSVKPVMKRIALFSLLLILPALFVVGEVRYASQIRPTGVRTIAQHLKRFGDPQRVYQVERDGTVYYELQGFPGGHPPHLAVPSSAPAYIYDREGRLIDWCPDPGDMPQHRQKWPKTSDAPIDIDTFLFQHRR